MSSISVEVGTEVVQLSVPIDLLCALLLTNPTSGGSHYTLQEVAAASENLKRFRGIAATTSSSLMGSTSVPSSSSGSILPTPNNEPFMMNNEYPMDGGLSVDMMSLDSNGSIFVQDMIVKANEYELGIICDQIMNQPVHVCSSTHGCRVVQRLLEYGSPDQVYALFLSIPRFKVVDLCMDVNGNHVMQKFADTLSQEGLHAFVSIITDQPMTVSRLSLHSYGCRVIQRLLVKCNEEDRSHLLGFVIACFPDIVCDQFGNYVAQHSIEYSNDSEKAEIISVLTLMDVLGLCCNKFASNVVEKAIRVKLVASDKTVLHRLIATIIQDEDSLLSLMKDKYGNYVVKAICDLSALEFPEVVYVRNMLLQHSAVLKKFTYGFHLVERLEKTAFSRNRAGSNFSESSGSASRSRGGSH
jgi:hypothetical protein